MHWCSFFRREEDTTLTIMEEESSQSNAITPWFCQTRGERKIGSVSFAPRLNAIGCAHSRAQAHNLIAITVAARLNAIRKLSNDPQMGQTIAHNSARLHCAAEHVWWRLNRITFAELVTAVRTIPPL
jgi:hypothetical protein